MHITPHFKTLSFTPDRVLSTWAIQGGSQNSVVVFTLVGDERGNTGVVVRHHAYAKGGNPLDFMDEFCVWDGGGNVAIRHSDILPMDIARGVWNRFTVTKPTASYKAWVKVASHPYTIPPNEFLYLFGVSR